MIDIKTTIVAKALNNLQSDTLPHWGKMTAIQMIDHLLYSVKIGNGEIVSPTEPNEEKALKFQQFLTTDHPMPKGYDAKFASISIENPTVKDLEEGKDMLLKSIDYFITQLEENPKVKYMNPEFGLLDLKQWEKLHTKHFTHHFSQFGLI